MNEATPTSQEPIAVEKVVCISHGSRGKKLFSIIDRYTILAFLAFPLILGVETYYQNTDHSDHTFYIGGGFSFAYLICILVVRYQRKQVWNRWRRVSATGLVQRIRFSADGVETEETVGMRQFTPWVLIKKCQIGRGDSIQIVSAGASTIIVTRSLFTEKELTKIEGFFRDCIKSA